MVQESNKVDYNLHSKECTYVSEKPSDKNMKEYAMYHSQFEIQEIEGTSINSFWNCKYGIDEQITPKYMNQLINANATMSISRVLQWVTEQPVAEINETVGDAVIPIEDLCSTRVVSS
jgi:hypothetical protein